jgi:hypothetical protein
MIRFEEIAYTAAIHPGRMGERWQASAVRVRIPALHIAASMLRSTWCKADRCGVWPATMSLAPGASALCELASTGGGTRSGEP